MQKIPFQKSSNFFILDLYGHYFIRRRKKQFFCTGCPKSDLTGGKTQDLNFQLGSRGSGFLATLPRTTSMKSPTLVGIYIIYLRVNPNTTGLFLGQHFFAGYHRFNIIDIFALK